MSKNFCTMIYDCKKCNYVFKGTGLQGTEKIVQIVPSVNRKINN